MSPSSNELTYLFVGTAFSREMFAFSVKAIFGVVFSFWAQASTSLML